MRTMDDETYIELLRAIREHSGMELSAIRQAGEYGADAGWPGFTYVRDAAEFTEKKAALIDRLLQVDADEMGADDVASFVASFNRADMADTIDGYKNLLAWYALEAVGRYMSDRQEARR